MAVTFIGIIGQRNIPSFRDRERNYKEIELEITKYANVYILGLTIVIVINLSELTSKAILLGALRIKRVCLNLK